MKSTIIFQNTFGLNIARNVRLHGVRSGKPFQSSLENKLVLSYTPKGNRKPLATRFEGAVSIVAGWVDVNTVNIETAEFFGKSEKAPSDAILVFNDDLVLEKCDKSLHDLKQFDISKLKTN